MDLVAHYLIAARAVGRSPKTIAWHQASLKQCDSWRDEHGIPGDPESWTPSVLRANVIYQQDRTNVRTGQPLSGSHINGLIRSVKVFCRWLRREELVHRDLFAKIRVPKPPILVVPTLSQPEIKQLLAAIRAGRQPKRDEALFLFMLEPSVRASELCGIDFEDLSFEWGIARVMDQGRKQRYVPISPKTTRAMQQYAMAEERTDGPIFRSSRGDRLTPWGLNQLFGRWSARCGVHVYPPLVRHSFATEYLRGGGNLAVLQRQLGHTILAMTMRYLTLVTDDLVAEHQKCSPVMRLT